MAGALRRKRRALTLAVLMVAAGCSDDDGGDAAAPTTTTVAPATVSAPEPIEGCTDIGPPPAEAEVTWVAGGRLFARVPGGETRCLLAVPPGDAAPEWAAGADRVLAATGGARLAGETKPLPVGSGTASWSYPTGTSLISTSGGKLTKVNLANGSVQDLTFLARHDETVYHPGGRYVFSAGLGDDGQIGVHLADNRGENPRPVVAGETAGRIHSLAFSGARLLFVAEHPDNPPDDRHHIHYRNEQADPPLFQLAVPGGPVERLVPSPWSEGSHVAVEQGSCPGGRRTVAMADLDGAEPVASDSPNPVVSAPFRHINLDGRSTEAVGWLPGGRLVVLARQLCDGPGTLWVVPFAGGENERIATGADSAAVRAVEPRDGVPDVPVEAMGEGSAPVA